MAYTGSYTLADIDDIFVDFLGWVGATLIDNVEILIAIPIILFLIEGFTGIISKTLALPRKIKF